MRRLTLDFAGNFFTRLEAFLTVNLFYFLILFTVLMVFLLGQWNNFSSWDYILIAGFDNGIGSLVGAYILIKGAIINESFEDC
jgi:hypothetical protein